ncbi:MAG: mannose-1-phosphate guanylyltransferase [Methylotenera sp.]|nr:MAG: mannose-1-phosphate guanylyltransferase [Methylotenera sp.]
MKAMILAAGRGERMRPLTDHTPKPLLKIQNKPLIVWHLENLAKAGFEEVVINHAHLGEQIEAALGDGTHWNLQISYSPEIAALETAGGIAKALPLLTDNGNKNEAFLVVNGDTFTDIDFAQITLAPNMLAHLVLVNNPPQHPKGDFAINAGMLINQGEPMRTFSGVGVYHPNLFASIKRGDAAKLAPLLRQAIAENKATAQYHQGVWHDIGTPERLQALNNLTL